MILLIFSQQWVKAKLNYFELRVRGFLGRLEMTRRGAEIVRRTTNFKDERYVEDRRTARLRDGRLILTGARRSILTMSDELLVMSPLVSHARSSFVQLCNDEPIENSKFDRRTTNFKDKRCVEDRRTAILRGERRVDAISGRPTLVMSDELLVMSPLVSHARSSFVQLCNDEPIENSKFDRRTTNFKDEWYGEDRRTARCRDERLILADARRPILTMSDEILVVNSLVPSARSSCVQLCNDARVENSKFDRRTTNFKDKRYVEDRRTASEEWRDIDKFRPNAKKFGRNALAQWRDAFTDMPNAVSGGRNASTEWRNAFNSKRNADKIGRNAKKFRRNASALKLSVITSGSKFLSCFCGRALHSLKSYSSHLIAAAITAKILFCVCLAHAGQRGVGNPAAAGVAFSTDSIKPLQIGDTISASLWQMPLQMVKAGQEGSTTVTLNDYKGKLIILDFWATWCVPCIKSLDKLDSLQKQFDGEVVIVPTTYEELGKVKLFLAKKGWELPSLINDTVLKKIFPHRSIPHQVWLKDGVVKSIADAQSANAKNLKAMLKGEARILAKQPDVTFSPAEPLLSNGNGGDGSNLLFQSVLTGRMQADIGGVVSKGKNKILVYNNTLADLFKVAFLYKLPAAAQNDTRIVWEMPDSLRKACTAEGQKLNGDYEHDKAFYEWLKHNIYCYNLVYPGDLPREEVYRYMQDDLNKVFTRLKHIEAYVEKRPTRCIVLKTKKLSSHLKTNVDIKPKLTIENGIYNYRNWSFDRFVSGITNIYARQDKLPVVDRTGIDFPVNMQLALSGLNDLAALNQALGQYGISAQIDTVPIEMLVMKYIK